MRRALAAIGSLGLLASSCSRPSGSEPLVISREMESEDLLAFGPHAFDVGDYELPPMDGDGILDPAPAGETNPQVQLAGRVFLPRTTGPAPLLVFLHGNHSTCGGYPSNWNPQQDPRLDILDDFTWSGECPSGFQPVPSHKGYDYVASELASHGFAVVSIDSNRGITGRNNFDNANWSMVLPRGRLVLRTLELLHRWNGEGGSRQDLGLDLKGRLDFSEVGLMGHSRGGEGVRVAYNMYKGHPIANYDWQGERPEIGFRAIFEIGPIDGGSSDGKYFYEAPGVAWNVLIPGCDGDVSNYWGVNPYSRMLGVPSGDRRSIFVVWGANHNFFNTEWQTSDSVTCAGDQRPLWTTESPRLTVDRSFPIPNEYWEYMDYFLQGAWKGVKGSDAQRALGRATMTAFFRANVGKSRESRLARVFDPQYALPRSLTALAPVSREYSFAQHGTSLQPAGIATLLRESHGIQATGYLQYLQERIDFVKAQLASRDPEQHAVQHDNLTPRSSLVVRWSRPSGTGTPEAVFDLSAAGSLSDYRFLDLSLARLHEQLCLEPDAPCPGPSLSTDFSLALERADGTRSRAVRVSDYLTLAAPAGSFIRSPWLLPANDSGPKTYYLNIAEPLFDMVPLELSDFRDAQGNPFDLRGVTRLRMIFDLTPEAIVLVGDVRLVRER